MRVQPPFTTSGQMVAALLGCVLLLGYGLTVSFLGEIIGELQVKVWHIWLGILGGLVFLAAILNTLRRSQVLSPSGQTNLVIFVWSVLIGLIGGDVLFTLYANFAYKQEIEDSFGKHRLQDRQVWYGELAPEVFQPTELIFYIQKPNFQSQGMTYGELYDTSMLSSPTLKNSVLKLRQLTFFIDSHGFRDQTPIDQAQVFVLGDSFVFGHGTTQEKTWVELLERSSGKPLYNLGVSGTGPGMQYQLLKYVLENHDVSRKMNTVFWMIYEGNDLESGNEVGINTPVLSKMKYIQQILRGTILEHVFEFPEVVKRQSVVDHIKSGRIHVNGLSSTTKMFEEYDPYEIDGVSLQFPLYFSQKHGPRLFDPIEMQRVAKPQSYLLNHPNRVRLDETFQRMKELGQRYSFEVVVILAPSVVRAYGQYFEHFPAVSEKPFFLNYVEKRATEQKFRVLNLLPLFRPYTEQELLYYRDDNHWNERGNFIVADLIQEALFPSTSQEFSPNL